MITDATSDAQFSVVALIALVGLVVAGLLWWQRSRGALAGNDAIRLVSVRGLGGKRLLALVEVERERFLLGLTDESIACLARVAPQGEGAASSDAGAGVEAGRAWNKQSA